MQCIFALTEIVYHLPEFITLQFAKVSRAPITTRILPITYPRVKDQVLCKYLSINNFRYIYEASILPKMKKAANLKV